MLSNLHEEICGRTMRHLALLRVVWCRFASEFLTIGGGVWLQHISIQCLSVSD